MNHKKRFISNISSTFIAQIFIMGVSIIISFVLPKILSVEDYSLWQLFIFYSSYTGIFFLGINDGYILRNAGTDYKLIDPENMSLKVFITTIFQILIGIIFIIGVFALGEKKRNFIYISIIIYMIFQNIFSFVGCIHQAANNNKLYSIASIIERAIFVFLLFLSFVFKVNKYYYYIIFNLISVLISLLFIVYKSKLVFKVSRNIYYSVILDILEDFKVGIKIMLSNFSSTLIIGGGRFLIDKNWSIETFGKISLSISMLQLFLTFVTKASIVFFPAMKNICRDKVLEIYRGLYKILFFIGPLILMFYFPLKLVIILWLPDYYDSIFYLSILLPICIFESKMNLIYNTYLKMYRLENKLLFYNVFSFICFVIMALLAINFTGDVYLLLLSIVFSVILREIITSRFILKKLQINLKMQYLELIYVMLFFILILILRDDWISLIILFVVYIVYIVILRRTIRELLKQLTKLKEA